jgi:hypothetical protein
MSACGSTVMTELILTKFVLQALNNIHHLNSVDWLSLLTLKIKS